MGRKTNEIERKLENELSVRIELNEQSEEHGKHLVRENKQGMSEEKNLEIESIMKDNELVIHHEYTNFNLYFSSVLKVLLQNSMPYKDPFDDFVEVTYAFKGIYGVFIHCKKNGRYSCFKFRRKLQEYNSYKFVNLSSLLQLCNQPRVVLKLHSKEMISSKKFVFDPRGIMNLSTLEDGHDSRANHFEERGNDVNTSMTRNPNPIWIQDNDESPSTTRNPLFFV